MSNVTLYYVEGINRVDTPVFDSEINQYTFFDNLSLASIRDAFYVPKFKDEITLSSSDISFTTRCNYLSIHFNSKDYYYFIDRIEYKSETDIKLYISMDVIQTYMFNINILSGELIRKSIKRWVDGKINRGYIRENLSTSDFVLKSVKMYNKANDFSSHASSYANDDTSGTIVFKIPEDPWGKNKEGDRFQYSFDWAMETFSAFTHYIIPIYRGNLRRTNVKYRDYVTTAQDVDINENESLAYITKSIANIRDIYYFPFIPLQDIRTASGYTYYSGSKYRVRNNNIQYIGCLAINDGEYVNVNIFKDVHNLDFEENTSRIAAFSERYVPALLDENYMRVSFGEAGASATYPLFQLDTLTITSCYFANIIDGTRSYYFEGSLYITFNGGTGYSYSYKDPFACAVQAESPARLDIVTEQYASYMTYNKGALIGAVVKTIGGAFGGFVTGAAKSGAITSYTKSRYAANYSNPKVKSTIWAHGKYEHTLNDISTGEDMASSSGGLIDWAQGALNAAFLPDNPRQIGNVSADRLSNAVSVSYSEYRVQDFHEVAIMYESYGYKVHEIVRNGKLYNFNNRYYYDFVQFDSLNITLDLIQDLETLSLISDRLTNGLRLWHTTGGELHGDAVRLSMGQVCVYDNVEV